MKINLNDNDSNVIKSNPTYTLIDNTTLNNLIVSKTILHEDKNTNGHFHKGQEEVYHFILGHGRIQVGEDICFVNSGDIVLIPDGKFHKVWNTGLGDLEFICVFDGSRNH